MSQIGVTFQGRPVGNPTTAKSYSTACHHTI